jgi:hypothetical protein
VKKIFLNLIMCVTALVATVLYFSGYISAELGLILATTPPATVGGYTQQFVSAQGINMREFYPELVRKYGDQGSTDFMGTMIALGWTAEKAVQKIEHWEDDWYWDSFAVGSQAGGGATATLTIQPQSIDVDGNFYPAVKDVIQFPNVDTNGNYIQAYVTAVGANTIDIRVINAATNIPATVLNQELIVITNLSAEGTGQPVAKRSTYNLYQNDFSQVKTTTEMTGSEMTDTWWFESMDGKPAGAVTAATLELDYRQLVAEQGTLLTGITPSGVTDGGKTVKQTKGLFPTMNESSIQAPFTTWGQSNFDLINKSLSRVYAGSTTGIMMGLDLYTTNENQLIDFNKQTGIDMTTKEQNMSLFGEESGVAVVVNFKYYRKGDRTYAFKMINAMNHPKIYGAEGYNYTQRGWAFPLKSNNTDVKSKAKLPTICTVYRAKGAYKRSKEMFTTGSADVEKYGNTNDIDNRVLNCRSELGLEVFAANQFVNIKPA